MHLLRDWVLLEVLLNKLKILVCGGIVNNYDFVIGVILIEYRPKVVLIPEIFPIIQSGDDDAERPFG
jgi:hypothetical protein